METMFNLKTVFFCWWPVIANKQHSLSLLENIVSMSCFLLLSCLKFIVI